MYLDGFGNFFVIFVQNFFFYPCYKHFGPENHFFGGFLKIWFFAQNLTI